MSAVRRMDIEKVILYEASYARVERQGWSPRMDKGGFSGEEEEVLIC